LDKIKNVIKSGSQTLQVKFAIYNAISKSFIILAFMALLPLIIEKIVYDHIDKRLQARSEKVLKIIHKGGIDDIVLEQDCSFESYSILKEEFVAIYPITNLSDTINGISIANESRNIEGEQLVHRILTLSFIYDNQNYKLEIGEGISSIDQLKSTIKKFSLWMMLGVILISIFLDFAFVRILLQPFNKIINTKLKPVPAPINFDFTPIPSTTHEFNQLDNRINEMMHKLQDTFQLEKEFISNVSHELQTPISILQNRLENIIVSENVSDEVLIRLSESQKTLSRMSRIIKALLLISKIENDQYLKTDQVNISELLDEVIDELEDRIAHKNIHIVKRFYQEAVITDCNKALLHNMFFNIINNAIKYNNHEGEIIVAIRNINNQLIVEIEDNGIGMEQGQIPYIFDRFKRLNKSTAEGFGLGLPIVKTIAGFHKISFDVTSQPDKGTCFKCTFENKETI
jgi:signal transduction histidine kinase